MPHFHDSRKLFKHIKPLQVIFYIEFFNLRSSIPNVLEEESTNGGNRGFIVIEIKALNNKPRAPWMNREQRMAKLGDSWQRSKTEHCKVYFYRFFVCIIPKFKYLVWGEIQMNLKA